MNNFSTVLLNHRTVVGASLFLFLFAMYLVPLFFEDSACDLEGVNARIHKLCSEGPSGALCPWLCEMDSLMDLDGCTSGMSSKYVLSPRGKPFVVKWTPIEEEEAEVSWGDLTLLQFREAISEVIFMNYGYEVADPLVDVFDLNVCDGNERLETCSYKPEREEKIDLAVLHQLVQVQEFVMFKLLERESSLFPNVHSFCNNWFAVSRIEALSFDAVSPRAVVQLASQILKFVFHLQTLNVQLCDVKLGHFGIRPGDNRITFFDGDHIFNTRALLSTVRGQKCTVDSDCDFFDCKMECVASRCGGRIMSDLLQVICAKVFSTKLRWLPAWILQFFIPGPLVGGLLLVLNNRSIEEALQECIEGRGADELLVVLDLLRKDVL